MPSAAVHTGCVDFVLPLDEIPAALVTLVMKGMLNDCRRAPVRAS
jgi:chemotaxis response regulator CheB